jgi:SAM-dependent methyltransferase
MNKWIPYPRFLIRKNIINSILKKEDFSSKTAIEIGFGGGEMLIYFFKKILNISGYDESDLAFYTSEERLIQYNCNVELYKSFINIPKNYFDYLFAFEVLEHTKDDSCMLDNWLDLLKEDGKILISVPAHQKRFGIMDLSVGHYRRYDKSNLIKILKSKGLQIIQFWSYGFPIINILESTANYLLKNKKKSDFNRKEILSYKSFEATNKLFVRLISNNLVLFPFYCLQHLFLKTDFGSGYIILAQKNEKKVYKGRNPKYV